MGKTHVIAALAGVACLMVGGCATTGSGETALAQNGSDQEELICRRVHEVGSRLSSRACKTREEWENEAVSAQEAMERTMDARSAVPLDMGMGS